MAIGFGGYFVRRVLCMVGIGYGGFGVWWVLDRG